MAKPWAGFSSPGGMKYVLTPRIQLCKHQVAQLKLWKVGLKLVPSFASHHRAHRFVALAEGIGGRNLNCCKKMLRCFV